MHQRSVTQASACCRHAGNSLSCQQACPSKGPLPTAPCNFTWLPDANEYSSTHLQQGSILTPKASPCLFMGAFRHPSGGCAKGNHMFADLSSCFRCLRIKSIESPMSSQTDRRSLDLLSEPHRGTPWWISADNRRRVGHKKCSLPLYLLPLPFLQGGGGSTYHAVIRRCFAKSVRCAGLRNTVCQKHWGCSIPPGCAFASLAAPAAMCIIPISACQGC